MLCKLNLSSKFALAFINPVRSSLYTADCPASVAMNGFNCEIIGRSRLQVLDGEQLVENFEMLSAK